MLIWCSELVGIGARIVFIVIFLSFCKNAIEIDYFAIMICNCLMLDDKQKSICTKLNYKNCKYRHTHTHIRYNTNCFTVIRFVRVRGNRRREEIIYHRLYRCLFLALQNPKLKLDQLPLINCGNNTRKNKKKNKTK